MKCAHTIYTVGGVVLHIPSPLSYWSLVDIECNIIVFIIKSPFRYLFQKHLDTI